MVRRRMAQRRILWRHQRCAWRGAVGEGFGDCFHTTSHISSYMIYLQFPYNDTAWKPVYLNLDLPYILISNIDHSLPISTCMLQTPFHWAVSLGMRLPLDCFPSFVSESINETNTNSLTNPRGKCLLNVLTLQSIGQYTDDLHPAHRNPSPNALGSLRTRPWVAHGSMAHQMKLDNFLYFLITSCRTVWKIDFTSSFK